MLMEVENSMGYYFLGFAAGVAVAVIADVLVEESSSTSSSLSFLRVV